MEDFSDIKQQVVSVTQQLAKLTTALTEALTDAGTDAKHLQLKAICDSIRQLESRSVPVPDDLRRLKLDLTSSLAPLEDAKEARDILVQQLIRVLSVLNVPVEGTIRRRNSPPKRISLGELVTSGVLPEGTEVIHRRKRSGVVYRGKVVHPGAIELTIDGERKLFETPSAAGQAVVGGSVDGWNFWSVAQDNGRDVPLIAYRSQFVKENS